MKRTSSGVKIESKTSLREDNTNLEISFSLADPSLEFANVKKIFMIMKYAYDK